MELLADDASSDVILNDGRRMPPIGLGVYKMTGDQTASTVDAALRLGYRAIDTAAMYGNERAVGEGVRRSGLARSDVFVATKVRFEENGHDETLRAFDNSLTELRMDHVDLYLIHWPAPQRDRYVDAWRALIRLRDEGRALSIGVSNFHGEYIDRIVDETGVAPSVNQIELHPHLPQRVMRSYNADRGIVTQAWSPLARGRLLDDQRLAAIARKHRVTPAQIVLRWHLEGGVSVIPKSTSVDRIRQNLDVFGFTLDAEDHHVIDEMETGERTGVDPRDRN